MPDIQIVNPLDIPDWDNHLFSFPDATIFHSAGWARVLMGSYGFKPYYCITHRGKKISGILPLMEVRNIFGGKKAVSLPFTDLCEPLFNDQDDFRKAFEDIIDVAKNKKWRSIELRGGKQWLSNEPAYDTIYTHEIDITPEPDTIFKSFADSTRRNIRKAEKSGIAITLDNSIEAVKTFYRLNCLTRREHGLPPQPWQFFVNLHAEILAKKKGFITIAAYSRKPVAANIYLIFGEKALYKYGASDRRFQQLRPSNLVMWEGIKHCREIGCKKLNLGRTEKKHTGLLQYKRGFTGNEILITYYNLDGYTKLFQKGYSSNIINYYSLILKKIPIPILKIIGASLYKFAG